MAEGVTGVASCQFCQDAWTQRPEVIAGYLPAKDKGRKGREGSQNLITCYAQLYWEIDVVGTLWEYWKRLVESLYL